MNTKTLNKLSPEGRNQIIQLEGQLRKLELQINELTEEMPTL